ncbi:hypothetical protein Tco_0498017, partial [Tanacetum coccineum]
MKTLHQSTLKSMIILIIHEVEAGNLLLMEEEPRTYKEASKDEKWIEA